MEEKVQSSLSVVVQVCLTQKQHKMIRDNAKRLGLSRSQFMRDAVFGRSFHMRANEQLAREMLQIARYIKRICEQQDVESEVSAELKDTLRLLRQCIHTLVREDI